MKSLIMVTLLLNFAFSFSVNAKESDFKQYYNQPYSQVRVSLMDEGWEVVPNKEINDTSLYAQGIYEKGYEEVIDCISMERDQCQFILTNNKQYILVITKEKYLNVESIEIKH